MKENIRESQLSEAMIRLRMLGISPNDIQRLAHGNIPLYDSGESVSCNLSARQQDIARALETEYGVLVFAVIHDNIHCKGEDDSFLFVGRSKSDWLLQREDAQNGLAIAYVHSLCSPELSEIGTIAISYDKTHMKLVRTA